MVTQYDIPFEELKPIPELITCWHEDGKYRIKDTSMLTW